MLGALGRAGSNFLRSRGFEITRPSWIERKYLRSPWEVFGKNVALFSEVYDRNRSTLRRVKSWVVPETLQSSLWRYGIPQEWEMSQGVDPFRTGLSDAECNVTAADFIGFIARKSQPLAYLEIGVSVGKTFVQIANQVSDARLTALDLEEINPILAEQLGPRKCVWASHQTYSVETLSGVPALKRPTLSEMVSAETNNIFEYLSADQFREDTWERLAGRKFNLVFSDGVHTGEALRAEYDFLIKNELVDMSRPFSMFWDDLINFEMQDAFLSCAGALADRFSVTDQAISIYRLHGSYGLQRLMGFFGSAPLTMD